MNVYLLVVGKIFPKQKPVFMGNPGREMQRDLTSQGDDFWDLMISWEKNISEVCKSAGWEQDMGQLPGWLRILLF